ncbi:transposase [Bacteroides xylanisolvens]|nr:transposase [Bacteroides xylanisolvens]
MELTNIYNKHYDKDVARGKLALWYNKIEKLGYGCFRTVTNTMQNYYETILNYFVNRETNAFAESFNAKIKAFRAQFRGVGDIPFFIFRLCKLTV